MKLTVEKGELKLPEGFSFEIEKNSAFFSDEGTASLGVTIPATQEDLRMLGFPARVARSSRFVNLFPAMISSGIFQKKGQLAVTSVTGNSISCAVALEDSDFYSQFKDKDIKELFSEVTLTTYSTPSAWYSWLFKVYSGTVSSEFRVIPVAVAYDEASGSYQVNNEPVDDDSSGVWPLAHEARVVIESGENVSVPEGYGIAPFFKLYEFIEKIFTLCGYTISKDCFRDNPDLNSLILLHNCSDVICKGFINYGDLVPSGKVSEILEWLLLKFHAQIVVYPERKEVDIVLMNDILAAGFDLDLTGKLLEKASLNFQSSSRVILSPDTSLEGAAPVAETEEDMIAKYGELVEFDEASNFYDDISCFALRLSEGRYFEARLSLINQKSKLVPVGSNYFKYDKKNSEGSEEFAPADLIPPMVRQGGVLMPYIGDRKHRNTCYNGSEIDEEQDIIIVDYAGRSVKIDYSQSGVTGRIPSDTKGSHYFYGTTQKYDNAGKLREGKYTLNAPGLYEKFFKSYNKILLNNSTEISGQFSLNPAQILDFNMYALKLYDGQFLLPKSLRYVVGKSIKCLEASFLLVKDFDDAVEDPELVISGPVYKWQINNSEIAAQKDIYTEKYALAGRRYVTSEFEDDYSEYNDVYLTPPTALGQKTAKILRTVAFYYVSYGGANNQTSKTKIDTHQLYQWFESVEI